MPELSFSGRLPKGERNGLPALVTDLIKDPKTPRLAVVLINTSKITRDSDTGDEVPTVRILGIEPMIASEDAAVLDRLVRRAVERRTGSVELPFELEEAIDSIRIDAESDGEPA